MPAAGDTTRGCSLTLPDLRPLSRRRRNAKRPGFARVAFSAPLSAPNSTLFPCAVSTSPAALAAPLACQARDVRSVTHSCGLRLPAGHLVAAMALFGRHWESAGLSIPSDGGMCRGPYIDIAPASLQPAGTLASHRVLRLNPYAPGSLGPTSLPLPCKLCSRAVQGRACI
jgi:hypothetical protein